MRGVDLDDVVIGLENIDLGESGSSPTIDDHLARVALSGTLAVALGPQAVERMAIARHPDRKMNVAGIDGR